MPTSEVNLLVLSRVNVKKLLVKMKEEMKSFSLLAKERIYNHQENILRSLLKDRKAFKILQKSQRGEINPKSPVQFLVKNLRAHLEAKEDQNPSEGRLYRVIRKSPVADTDSEDDEDQLEERIIKENSTSGS